MNSAFDPSHFANATSSVAIPGSIQALASIGREEPTGDEQYPAAVFILRYQSAAAGGCGIVAKLHVPLGQPPPAGWPVSVFVHGLGDPATDFRRWPFVGNDWRNARGFLASRWANHGIATLTPWLPGAGPSQPFATYSPFSLDRNSQAIIDGCIALHEIPHAGDKPEARLLQSPAGGLDLSHLVLRADCVSTSLLINLASRWRNHECLAGLRALVADDFLPSHAYSAHYLSRPNGALPAADAALMWCVWSRCLWSLAQEQGWPLTTFFTEKAIEFFSAPVRLPLGQRDRIYALRLTPKTSHSMPPLLTSAASDALGSSSLGEDLRRWLFSPDEIRWMSLPTLKELVTDSFYQQYLAASDPYFKETIEPFASYVPLIVVGRGETTSLPGMPSLADRHRYMTLPRVRTLRDWGWDVQLHENLPGDGTSFSGGPAQQRVLMELAEIL